MTIPAYLNPQAGSAERIRNVLSGDARFDARELAASELAEAVRADVLRGVSRVLVAGGDGTVAAAAGALADSEAELAILPGGTLNHFARARDIPGDPRAALDLAAEGVSKRVDVGFVNDRVFLNTSSVGAYVAMVHLRERLRPRLGYHLAGAVSGIALFLRYPCIRLDLEIDRERRHYRTPLLFVGVGERDISLRRLGERSGGRSDRLHAMVIRGGGRTRLVSLAFVTATRGVRGSARTPHLDSELVERCRVEASRGELEVAVDGETVVMRSPLEYRIAPGALRVVSPAAGTGQNAAR